MNAAYLSTSTARVLHLVLAFYHPRWFVYDRHVLPPLLLLVSLDGENTLQTERSLFAGLERPHDFLGSQRLPKVGSLQPIPVFGRVQINRRVLRNLYAPNNFASPSG
jgi:hypothetical protein